MLLSQMCNLEYDLLKSQRYEFAQMIARQESATLWHRLNTLNVLFSCLVLYKLTMNDRLHNSAPSPVVEYKTAKDILCHFSKFSLAVHTVSQLGFNLGCISVVVELGQLQFFHAVHFVYYRLLVTCCSFSKNYSVGITQSQLDRILKLISSVSITDRFYLYFICLSTNLFRHAGLFYLSYFVSKSPS